MCKLPSVYSQEEELRRQRLQIHRLWEKNYKFTLHQVFQLVALWFLSVYLILIFFSFYDVIHDADFLCEGIPKDKKLTKFFRTSGCPGCGIYERYKQYPSGRDSLGTPAATTPVVQEDYNSRKKIPNRTGHRKASPWGIGSQCTKRTPTRTMQRPAQPFRNPTCRTTLRPYTGPAA